MARTVQERADVVPLLTEVFREHGYEGASLALIGQHTGLGKGSLYHFFPGGKEEMAKAALDHIAAWFEEEIFWPLDADPDPIRSIDRMFDAVAAYFQTGRRACLVGAFALDRSRDMFARQISTYFARWVDALASALNRANIEDAEALARAMVGDIQGAIVLSRALDDRSVFQATIQRLRQCCGLPARP